MTLEKGQETNKLKVINNTKPSPYGRVFKLTNMGRKGRYAKSPEWGKHLKEYKQVFWSQEREGAKKDLREQINKTIENEDF